MKISLLEEEHLFNTFFFQKWGFFAPPPSYNDRLYYTFESKKDSTIAYTFEVIETLQKKKSKKAPFNSSEDILDYVLSSSLHSVADGLFAVNQAIDYEKETGKSTDSTDFDRFERGKNYTQTTANFKTLKNYAKLVFERNKIGKFDDFYLIIDVVQSDMPKFADRNKLGERPEKESLIFKSAKIEF